MGKLAMLTFLRYMVGNYRAMCCLTVKNMPLWKIVHSFLPTRPIELPKRLVQNFECQLPIAIQWILLSTNSVITKFLNL